MLLKATFLALDTSHLVGMIDDAISHDLGRRKRAITFQEQLATEGYILLVTHHHVEELLQIDNETIARSRLLFLRSLPLIASIKTAIAEEGAGSVLDIMQLEVKAAVSRPNQSTIEILHSVSKDIFRVGAAKEVLQPYLDNFVPIRTELSKRKKRAQEIVSIRRAHIFDNSDRPFSDYKNGDLRNTAEADRILAGASQKLSNEIAQRGDARIIAPSTVAASFFDSVRWDATIFYSSENHRVDYLKQFGIEESDIPPKATLGQIGELATHMKQLQIINSTLQLPWTDVKKYATAERLPCWIVVDGIRKHRQDLPRTEGGEINDSYLACLSCYTTITFVDKRTLENITRAKAKDRNFAKVVGRTEKASNYLTVLSQMQTAHSRHS